MTAEFKRTDRIAVMLQRKLSLLIKEEIKDPRMASFVTIASVEVSKDLAYAKVYFTVFNHDPKETAKILNASAGFLRKTLARSLTLRTVPQLQFVYDESLVYGQALSQLIDKANQSTAATEDDQDISPD